MSLIKSLWHYRKDCYHKYVRCLHHRQDYFWCHLSYHRRNQNLSCKNLEIFFDINLKSFKIVKYSMIFCHFPYVIYIFLNVILMSFWCHFDVILMSFWCHFDVILMSFWCHLKLPEGLQHKPKVAHWPPDPTLEQDLTWFWHGFEFNPSKTQFRSPGKDIKQFIP
jgi:hypothetical protein